MKYYSIGKFAELIGKTPQTLRDWHKKGIFLPNHITSGGTRYYSKTDYYDSDLSYWKIYVINTEQR